MTELKQLLEDYRDFMNRITYWYDSQSGILQRFLKYGGWIAIQFWIIRAPMTVLLTGIFPERISLILIDIPGYLLASFTSGSLLAIVGFILSERWIWGSKTDEI